MFIAFTDLKSDISIKSKHSDKSELYTEIKVRERELEKKKYKESAILLSEVITI
jgi:hypothetical protein